MGEEIAVARMGRKIWCLVLAGLLTALLAFRSSRLLGLGSIRQPRMRFKRRLSFLISNSSINRPGLS